MTPNIERMIKIGQPILVFKNNGMLIAHYLTDPSPNDSFILNKATDYIDFANSLLRPLDSESYSPAEFHKVHQKTIHHLGVAFNYFTMRQGNSKKNNTKDAYRLIKDIFYYAAQDDAIGVRERARVHEKTLILYSPRLVEVNFLENKSNKEGIVPFGKTKFRPEIDIYLKKSGNILNSSLAHNK